MFIRINNHKKMEFNLIIVIINFILITLISSENTININDYESLKYEIFKCENNKRNSKI